MNNMSYEYRGLNIFVGGESMRENSWFELEPLCNINIKIKNMCTQQTDKSGNKNHMEEWYDFFYSEENIYNSLAYKHRTNWA